MITTKKKPTPMRPVGNERTNDQLPEVQANATRKCLNATQTKFALPILPVVVSDPEGSFSMNVFALLHSRSNGTFCSTKLIHALKLKSRKMNIALNTMEARNVNLNTLVVNRKVKDTQRQNTYLMKGVLCRNRLNISLKNLVTPDEVYK